LPGDACRTSLGNVVIFLSLTIWCFAYIGCTAPVPFLIPTGYPGRGDVMITGHRCQIGHLWPVIMEQSAAPAAARHGHTGWKREHPDHMPLPGPGTRDEGIKPPGPHPSSLTRNCETPVTMEESLRVQ
jgi:hypothetical protein